MAKQKKREDGRYCKNVTIGRNEDGSLKRKMIYANTKADLDLKVADLLLQKEKGVIIDDKNKTVDKWADEWLMSYTSSFKDSTTRKHRTMINKYIKPNFKNVRLKDLKQYQVQKVLNEIKSPSVPKRFLITLNKILDAAVENDFISKNVADTLNTTIYESEPKEPLNEEQISAIKSNAHEIQELCVFLIYSGLRINESINLLWNDVDLKNKTIKIHGDVKTKNSNRTIPLLAPAYEILKKFDKKRVKNINSNSEYVFLSDGKKYNLNELARLRYEYCEMLGFGFTFHQCRHTFATILYNAGVDIKQAQEWLGHASFNTTMNIYTHLSEQNKTSNTDKINEYLKTV